MITACHPGQCSSAEDATRSGDVLLIDADKAEEIYTFQFRSLDRLRVADWKLVTSRNLMKICECCNLKLY